MMKIDRSVTDGLGERIFGLRDDLGWSQKELAKRAGISRTTLSHLESGATRAPSSATLYRLARALDTSVYEMLVGELTTKDGEAKD